MIEKSNLENTEFKDFYTNFSEILKKMSPNLIKDYNFIYLPGDELPWRETNVNVKTGEKITVISKGEVCISRQFNIWFEPHLQLWFRIAENGNIFNGPQNTFTFTADSTGKLFLANYLQDWADKSGNTNPTDEKNYKRLKVQGGISILIIRWREDPFKSLEQLAAIGDYENLIIKEINRLLNPVHAPDGWKYLWSIGESDVFWQCTDDKHEQKICCYAKGQAAILQKDVSLILDPNTTIRWSWKIDLLPSENPENLLFYHDYLSIAVEFNNRQDITYHWSCKLPVETAYRCPFPTWTNRETHVVIRSGKNGLKSWINEQRNLYNDYRNVIGDPPEKIIRVWLIVNTQIQNVEGKCEFADIELVNNKNTIKIL
ncbi:MAG: DUF3047 domain-containing protein [Promethearchaeota archaeon]